MVLDGYSICATENILISQRLQRRESFRPNHVSSRKTRQREKALLISKAVAVEPAGIPQQYRFGST